MKYLLPCETLYSLLFCETEDSRKALWGDRSRCCIKKSVSAIVSRVLLQNVQGLTIWCLPHGSRFLKLRFFGCWAWKPVPPALGLEISAFSTMPVTALFLFIFMLLQQVVKDNYYGFLHYHTLHTIQIAYLWKTCSKEAPINTNFNNQFFTYSLFSPFGPHSWQSLILLTGEVFCYNNVRKDLLHQYEEEKEWNVFLCVWWWW